MINIDDWVRTQHFERKPWLLMGKGPTFALHTNYDLSRYHLFSLNHVVRELRVHVAHMIDIDVLESCAGCLAEHCDFLIMPRRPHVNCLPGEKLLEDFFGKVPVLQNLDKLGRLIWYNLSNGPPVGASAVIKASFFSSAAALGILARMKVPVVRSLGIDGARSYSPAFADLEVNTKLANGQPSFDLQFPELQAIAKENQMDYRPLVEPMRVFVGTDESQIVAARVLEHSIRKFASRPVEFVPMLNMKVPLPLHEENRPRTGFSFCRFLIPQLCNYQGRALYLDADMQVFADLAELFDIPFGPHKVLCTNQPGRPDAWKHGAFFKPGRQLSVMMLDCSRLPWNIQDIVGGLDSGKYTYSQLMSDLCIVDANEIADRLPPEWNCLEHYEPAQSKLVHYTVVPTQPWKNDDNPLRSVWTSAFREAVSAGAVPYSEIENGMAAGHLKPSLVAELVSAVNQSTSKPDLALRSLEAELVAARVQNVLTGRALTATRQELMHCQSQLASLRSSVSWKIGQAATYPVRHGLRFLRSKAA